MAKEVVVDLKLGNFNQLKSDLKEAKQLLASLPEGSEQFEEVAERAGEIARKIDDINDATKLAKEEGLFKFGEGFKQITTKIAEGDFTGASKQIAAFSKSLSSVNFSGLISGFKNFIGVLGQLGKVLLANPIFLIVAIIAGIVIAIVTLKDKVKILGAAFEFFGDIIGAVIQALKDFTDWLGLTSFAAEEKARATIDAAKKEQEAIDERYRVEMALAQIAGKNTIDLEIEKTKAQQNAVKTQMDALEEIQEMNGTLSDEDKKELEDRTKEYEKYTNDLIILNAKKNKEIEDENKKAQEQEEKERQDSIKKWKDFQANRVSAARQARDLEISLIEDTREREIAIINERYKRLIEDTKKNEKLTQDERTRIIKLAEQNRAQDLADLQNKYAQEEIEREQEKTDALKKEKEKQLEDEKKLIERLKSLRDELYLSNQQKEIQTVEDTKNARIAIIDSGLQQGLISQADYDKALAEIQTQSNEEIAAINKKYLDAELKEQLDGINKKISFVDTYKNAVSTLTASLFEITNNLGKQDEASQLARAKRQFKIKKALDVAEAGINTAKAITKAIAEFGPPPSPLGIAGIATASVIGAAQIAAILSKKFEGGAGGDTGGGGSVGGGAGAGASSFTPSVFSPTLTSTGGSSTTTVGAQSQQNTEIRAYVVETDISTAQKRISNFQQESVI